MLYENILGGLLGVAVGDALGVPVEFKPRDQLDATPVVGMSGYGMYNLPPGSWSDDSSLMLCTAESLVNGFDLKDIAKNFLDWRYTGLWTFNKKTPFDIGRTTSNAIWALYNGESPEKSGLVHEESASNGSLMRILPVAFFTTGRPVEERLEISDKISAITHGHPSCLAACGLYTEMIIQLANDMVGEITKEGALKRAADAVLYGYAGKPQKQVVEDRYKAILDGSIAGFSREKISAKGGVGDSFHAAMWSFLTTNTFSEAVLKAVNLGDDTDTIGAITGGLAGVFYGPQAIPQEWLSVLARKEDIVDLAKRLSRSLKVATPD